MLCIFALRASQGIEVRYSFITMVLIAGFQDDAVTCEEFVDVSSVITPSMEMSTVPGSMPSEQIPADQADLSPQIPMDPHSLVQQQVSLKLTEITHANCFFMKGCFQDKASTIVPVP